MLLLLIILIIVLLFNSRQVYDYRNIVSLALVIAIVYLLLKLLVPTLLAEVGL